MITIQRLRQRNTRRLVIVRAGHSSLHQQWFANFTGDREFDLLVYAYQGDVAAHGGDLVDLYAFAPGKKFKALKPLLEDNPWLYEAYDSFWLVDDDIQTTAADINRLFGQFEAVNATLAQPALTQNSYYSYIVVMQNPYTHYRQTNFVEVMCPVLGARTLREFVQFFDVTESGWGIDNIWSHAHVSAGLPLYIFDDIAVRHTRPVFGGDAYKGLDHPWQETEPLLRAMNITDLHYHDIVFHLKNGGVLDRRQPHNIEQVVGLLLNAYFTKMTENDLLHRHLAEILDRARRKGLIPWQPPEAAQMAELAARGE